MKNKHKSFIKPGSIFKAATHLGCFSSEVLVHLNINTYVTTKIKMFQISYQEVFQKLYKHS